MKVSFIFAAVSSCAVATATAATMDHFRHHAHAQPSKAVKFGPNGCIDTWKNVVDKCMIATHCKGQDLSNYTVAILCVDSSGQKVRHDFGLDSFDLEETFDTSVPCHHCDAEDAVSAATVTTLVTAQATHDVKADNSEPVALAAAEQPTQDPTWQVVGQLTETVKAMKEQMKQVSAVVDTMNQKVFPKETAGQPLAGQLPVGQPPAGQPPAGQPAVVENAPAQVASVAQPAAVQGFLAAKQSGLVISEQQPAMQPLVRAKSVHKREIHRKPHHGHRRQAHKVVRRTKATHKALRKHRVTAVHKTAAGHKTHQRHHLAAHEKKQRHLAPHQGHSAHRRKPIITTTMTTTTTSAELSMNELERQSSIRGLRRQALAAVRAEAVGDSPAAGMDQGQD